MLILLPSSHATTKTACIPVRYIVSILGSIAMAIIYGLKVNLSVAIVAMVNHTAIKAMSAAEHLEHDIDVRLDVSPARVECSAPNVSAAEAAVNHVSIFHKHSVDHST